MTDHGNAEIKGDRALSSSDKDKLGFSEVAKRIADSLIDKASQDGLVIGIEGAWGSGKSSLLFLIGKATKTLTKADILLGEVPDNQLNCPLTYCLNCFN